MSPILTFGVGLFLLFLFGWYFVTENAQGKRILGSALTVVISALCLVYAYPLDKKIIKGIDLQGGTSFLIRLIPEKEANGTPMDISKDMVDRAVETIRKRVDAMGTNEPVITPSGTDRILVQIPRLAPEQLQEVTAQLQKVAKLEFRLVHPQSDAIISGQMPPDPAFIRVVEKITRDGKTADGELMVSKKPDVTGDKVTRARARTGNEGWEVGLDFNSEGGDQFGKLTMANKGERFAIMLDGVAISAPVIKSEILGGSALISGSFTEAEARGLASGLENPLKTPVKIEEVRSTSPSLGAEAIQSGIYAATLGLGLICIAVLFYYRLAGLVALVALAVEGLLLLGLMAMFGAVLTLPGIAGAILTLGMAIDANVLIYERLREEIATGKSLKAALDASYAKAFSAIFDSHVTTLITAAILFWMATGPVKGFAVTLTMGIVVSLFTALVITRNIFSWLFHLNVLRRISMANLIGGTQIDFLGKRRMAAIVTTLLILALGAAFALRGSRNFGVDFRGGDRLVLEAEQTKPSEGDIRTALDALNLGDFVVQTERSATAEFLTVRSPEGTSEKVEAHLKAQFPQAGFRTEGSERVGSLVGKELIRSSLIALGLGLLGILIYVGVQFEFSFAIGALAALLIDLILTIGIYSLAGREISLIFVGAVLTIAGYSVNDKIVVFDRIREGVRGGRHGTVEEIMNEAINVTLSRTLLTGGTTLLALGALYFLGGPVLNDFAFSIFVGVVVGTVSSIYIAPAIVLWWSGKGGHGGQALREELKRSEARAAQEKAAVLGSGAGETVG